LLQQQPPCFTHFERPKQSAKKKRSDRFFSEDVIVCCLKDKNSPFLVILVARLVASGVLLKVRRLQDDAVEHVGLAGWIKVVLGCFAEAGPVWRAFQTRRRSSVGRRSTAGTGHPVSLLKSCCLQLNCTSKKTTPMFPKTKVENNLDAFLLAR